ncbi:5-bromo-4-chloroindolyl phosphate hydrolysis family protein [Butyrivibrio proteoclasticus]|uniref:5-bromo-4-chloroindolyl phosphate hydrolysis family protein n=1 Tax=Butyrivibrio proteoclasticus TaxID=43305 RepID=UPI000689054F|nr:5-bromo-4-chloroindolyl phosphate hydrolysis family protein [Butyrivibrio proteoclasticus]
MSNNINDLNSIGNEIYEAVTKAVESQNFTELANQIKKTVSDATKSINISTGYASVPKKTYYASGKKNQTVYTVPNNNVKPVTCPFLWKRVSKYDGLPQMILSVIPAIPFFVFFILSLTSASIVGSAIFGILLAMCGFVFFKGDKKLKLSSKYYQYGNRLWGKEYFKVSDLAKVVMKSDDEVRKDLKNMIKMGYLPRAKFDSTETTLMITDDAYQLYLGAEKDRVEREAKELKRDTLIKKSAEVPGNLPPKVREILRDGQEYIAFVKSINDVIPDTDEMSTKLYHLEDIMNKIFEQVKKEPQSADELHKLMNYYLPTTKKLLQAYIELDKQNHEGENISQTKKEIESAIDTINMAFENLLDSLFQDMAWDISSDISVMKTMLAQDGLTTEGQGVAMQMKR